jgi:hypothetical protein
MKPLHAAAEWTRMLIGIVIIGIGLRQLVGQGFGALPRPFTFSHPRYPRKGGVDRFPGELTIIFLLLLLLLDLRIALAGVIMPYIVVRIVVFVPTVLVSPATKPFHFRRTTLRQGGGGEWLVLERQTA